MRVLSESRVTNSVVTLAADLWRTTGDWQPFDVEPLVTWAVESLAEKGLVKYVEGTLLDDVHPEGDHQSKPITRRVPMRISLTQQGWEVAGYPRMVYEVGQRAMRSIPGRLGDMTSFRNHGFHTQGGPIEKEDFATHRIHYPHHQHDYAMEGDLDDMARSYLRITPEIEASVLAARSVLGIAALQSEVADLSGIPERTVRYVETDMPRLRRMGDGEPNAAASLKQRLIWLLEELPEGAYMRDVREVSRVLGRADSDHDIVHVLHSLHTQGRVDFKEDRGGDAPTHIHLRRKGSKKKENGVAVEQSVAPTVEPDPKQVIDQPIEKDNPTPPLPWANNVYPLLEALLDREKNRQSLDAKAMAYIEAAEAVKTVDPDMAAALSKKADDLNVVFPSPIEQEYIQYVAAHPYTPYKKSESSDG